MNTLSKSTILYTAISFLLVGLIFCGVILDYNLNNVSPERASRVNVYITRTGECYHRSGCRYLRQSKIEITLDEAYYEYRDCSVCDPPIIKK